MTPKTAGNYIRVHQRFGERRDSIERLGLKPTTLIKLETAPDEVVDEVFGRLEAGETLIGCDVEQILRAGRPPNKVRSQEGETAHAPGRKGLIAFLDERLRRSVDEWIDRLTVLHATVEAAMPDQTAGKRFRKGEFVTAVTWEARWLENELERMCGYGFWNKADQYLGKPWEDRPKWPDGRWKDVDDALRTLSYCENFKVEGLVNSLRTHVLPALEWALAHNRGMVEDGQELPPEFAREMDRLGIGATVVEARDRTEGADDQPGDPVAEPNAEPAISACHVEAGACPTTQADSIVLTADLTTAVAPPINLVPGVSFEVGSEDGKTKGFKRPPFLSPHPSTSGPTSASGSLP